MTAKGGDQAVANGREVTRYDQGYCQKFVRGPCWEVGSLYSSAIDAWNGARYKHPGDRTPPVGAPCYYRGGKYGHAVIYVGNGRIRSTDCTSATHVSDTDLSWPEHAWGYSYLGWTGDINAVTLPLTESGSGGGGDDEMNLSDPIAMWSPDEGTADDQITVGKTLNQARGYAEDAYDRIKQLEKKVDQILDKLS